MTSSRVDGWFWAAGQIVGSAATWETVYMFSTERFPTREKAVSGGLVSNGHDDFNVGQVVGGALAWFGWMDEQHPSEDYPDVARQLGLPVAVAS